MVKKKEDKTDSKLCFTCNKSIDLKKDKYVLLATFNNIIPDEYCYFHFNCWADYFNKRVEIKMKQNIKLMQEKAIKLFNSPTISAMLEQVQGSGIALEMLKTPIYVEIEKTVIVPKKQVLKKLKDGKRREKRKAVK